REEGYPNVFYADYYGASYTDKGYDVNLAPVENLPKLVTARKEFAYGTQHSYMDHWDVIGWTREGDSTRDEGLAVLMSDGGSGSKWMYVGDQNAGETFYDYTGNRSDTVTINSDGWGEFKTNGGSVSVWVGE
ncbi:MAG: alpha-amylase domain-containing protein, partial [Fusobacteriota bacterium]